MAAKKQKKNNGINLLKGITGSKLAKLIAILFILAIIPITVLMSQKQQNTEQQAAGVSCPDKYGNVYGGCFDKTIYSCSTGFISGQCYGGANIQCCKGTVTKLNKCVDVNSYICSGGNFLIGKCPGAKNIRFCTGTPVYATKIPCAQYIEPTLGTSGYCALKSRCSQYTTKGACSTGYVCCVR